MFRSGQQIGIYTLVNRIGRGGFGEVWLAERRAKFVTTKVAVKLPLDEQVDHEAIKQEATLWEQASGHPNILPIIDADEYNGQVLIASEYAPDGSLDQWLKQHGKMSLDKAVETTIQVLDGLEFLHSRRIIHRDLKPANILLQGNMPRLADFGISRAIRTTTSRSEHISGTFAYMAPEALDGKRSRQTDIWSVGVNLYQFLTGELPFPQKETSVLFHAIMADKYKSLPHGFPPEISNILSRALAKLPDDRYKTALEMREDLVRLLRRTPWHNLPSSQLQWPSPPAKQKPDLPDQNVVATQVWEPRTETEDSQSVIVPASSEDLVPFRKGSKRGFSTRTRSIVIEPKFDSAQRFCDGLALVVLKERHFFIDKNGHEVIPISPRYDWADSFHNGIAKVNKDKKYGLIDRTGKEFVSPKYDDISKFENGMAQVRLNKKFGFIYETGREIVAPIYDETEWFPGITNDFKVYGLVKVRLGMNSFWIDRTGQRKYDDVLKDDEPGFLRVIVKSKWATELDKWGLLDKTGKELVPPKYARIDKFSEGLAKVEVNHWLLKKCGFIDEAGREVIAPIYGDATRFQKGLARVSIRGKSGFIDYSGREVIPLLYEGFGSEGFSEHHWDFSEDLVGVQLNGRWGFIDKAGQIRVPMRYDSVGSFHEGLACVLLNGKFGFVDKMGKEVISCKYDLVHTFNEGVAFVSVNSKYHLINSLGDEVASINHYDSVRGFKGGLAQVESNGKCGIINKTGKEVVPPKYDSISDFEHGLAKVKYNDLMGYIDANGELKYDHRGLAEEGLEIVGRNNKRGVIDANRAEVIAVRYDDIKLFSEGLAAIKLNDKWGFVDRNGVEVIPPKYDEVHSLRNGRARVVLDHKMGFIDEQGREIIKTQYHFDEDQFCLEDWFPSAAFEDGFELVSLDGEQYFYLDRNGIEYYEP